MHTASPCDTDRKRPHGLEGSKSGCTACCVASPQHTARKGTQAEAGEAQAHLQGGDDV